MIINNEVNTALKAPVRQVIAKVLEYDENNNLINTFYHNGILKSAVIDRSGNNNKFFGYGVCQKANIHLLDKNRELNITTANSFYIPFQASGVDAVITTMPRFFVTEVHRNEKNNELSVTAYDALYKALNHTIAEVGVFRESSLKAIVEACIAFFGGGSLSLVNIPNDEFNKVYKNINLEGTETIRTVLDMIAEATQSIYYLTAGGVFPIVFRRLNVAGDADYTITKDDYITLENSDNRRLTHLVITNELGNAVNAGLRETASGEEINIEKLDSVIEAKISSKNLIYYPYFNVSGNINGITYTINADRSITANGTATADSFFYLVQTYNLPAGTYTLNSVNLSVNRELRGAIYNLDGTLDRYLNPGTFTITEEKHIYIYLVILKGNTVNNITFKPILEAGTASTAYTPYIADLTTITATANGVNYTPDAKGNLSIEANESLTITTNATGALITVKYYLPNDLSGTTQFIRNNAFYDMQDNISEFADQALTNAYRLTISQFECGWRGNYLLEIGDKINFITKDNEIITSFLINDSVEYNGFYKQNTSWRYEDNEAETVNNPSSIGEALKHTFATVDKVNKEITIVASETEEVKADIATLYLTTDAINASVEKVEKTTTATADSLGKEITTLTNRVDAAITADEVSIAIQNELENGVNKVITSTGFTFDENGLTVSKSNSEMNTLITENGMIISKDNNEVLTANNKGVKAIDLYAETYLIVGDNSRFENYGSSRTGCFWIG